MVKTLAKPETGTGLTTEAEQRPLLDARLEAAALALDTTTRRYMQALTEARELPWRRALLLAEGIDALKRSIKPEFLEKIMALVGSPLGIGSDRGPGRGKGGADTPQYDRETVRDALVQSLLLGFYPVGGEWMLYKGRFFGCKAGWRRKLQEVPGISDVSCVSSPPWMQNGRQLVRVLMSWRLNGVPGRLKGTDGKPGIVVAPTAFGGESALQLAGKAEAKACHIAYLQATGSTQTLEDEDLEVVEGAAALPAGGGDNGDGPRALPESQLEPYLSQVRARAAELEMDDEAVTALAEKVQADRRTREGMRKLSEAMEDKLQETRTDME